MESPEARRYRKRFHPGVSVREWNDWRWQLRHRIQDVEGLERVVRLTDGEREGLMKRGALMPLSITPYYASLIDPDDPACPIRKTKIPRVDEFVHSPGEVLDPLGEESHRPVPGIVHTYPDKALFLVTDFCATYCRYCTRGRMVGKGEYVPTRDMWNAALDYVAATPAIRDVLLSGGDPLILSDERLEYLLSRLRAIPHVEMIRIGTKVPIVLPQRVTKDLAKRLQRVHPLFMSLHVVHGRELTPEVGRACARLADAGIPLGGQMVLLKGVNNDPAILRDLVHGQLKFRIRPYYLHQCDAILGSSHFRTTVEEGLALIESLHGHTSGYAVPMYMVDAPGGGGKVPLSPDYRVGRENDFLVLRNYRGETYRYYDGT
ncbi:MAG TPA: KamA family radical SAM protein [Kiritimatiellia bacterium]|nr:KamA family radical SAM protein [Kiritimatiellia bacterium]